MSDQEILKFENLPDGRPSLTVDGRVAHWRAIWDRESIALERLERRTRQAIFVLACGLAGVGALALAFWVYLERDNLPANPLLFFESTGQLLLFWFWLGVFAALFVVYRRSEHKANLHRLKVFKPNRKKNLYNAADSLSTKGIEAMETAVLTAQRLRQPEITPVHVFWGILRDHQVSSSFVRLGVDFSKLAAILKRNLSGQSESRGIPSWSDASQKLLLTAFALAYDARRMALEPLDILAAAAGTDQLLDEILSELELDSSKLLNVAEWFRMDEQQRADWRHYRRLARLKPGTNMDKAYTAVATPTLNYYSTDLTAAAKYGRLEMCVDRDKEIRALFQAFESGQTGVLFVGQPGVGKRAIVEGVAQLMVKEEVPGFLKDKRLLELDLPRLIGGADPSQIEERLLTIISEVNRAGNIVLYIDNLENIMGLASGTDASLDLSEVLAQALNKKALFCLASVNTENYTRHIEKTVLGQVLSTVGVAEPGFDLALRIIESKVSRLEGEYGIYFNYQSLEILVRLTLKYISDKCLPEKAINILNLAAVKVGRRARADKKQAACTRDDIAEIISEQTGIPASRVSESETEKLLNLEKNIHARMIGQDEAVKAVAGSLRRARAELREGKRPIASFLFLGPTGVGKTELAKTVAEAYFGDENYMIRLDMSEYQAPDSIRKMIGDVDGTLGYLTEAVRKKPFSLILLDEIEKAHPDILNLFLQLMDDGRLTDGQGRTINFTNSIVIATSNAGALYIQEAVQEGVSVAVMRQELIDNHLNKVMRPELINRFDGLIVFSPLTETDVEAIARLLLKKISSSLEAKGIKFRAEEEGVKILARAGFDRKFGARPLRRLLQDRVENEIASLILEKAIGRRDTVVINGRGEIAVEKASGL
jgi:ATP-dependent Clp protease ATP-binding subunit ClpC